MSLIFRYGVICEHKAPARAKFWEYTIKLAWLGEKLAPDVGSFTSKPFTNLEDCQNSQYFVMQSLNSQLNQLYLFKETY